MGPIDRMLLTQISNVITKYMQQTTPARAQITQTPLMPDLVLCQMKNHSRETNMLISLVLSGGPTSHWERGSNLAIVTATEDPAWDYFLTVLKHGGQPSHRVCDSTTSAY